MKSGMRCASGTALPLIRLRRMPLQSYTAGTTHAVKFFHKTILQFLEVHEKRLQKK
jgi:hypothetical protein